MYISIPLILYTLLGQCSKYLLSDVMSASSLGDFVLLAGIISKQAALRNNHQQERPRRGIPKDAPDTAPGASFVTAFLCRNPSKDVRQCAPLPAAASFRSLAVVHPEIVAHVSIKGDVILCDYATRRNRERQVVGMAERTRRLTSR